MWAESLRWVVRTWHKVFFQIHQKLTTKHATRRCLQIEASTQASPTNSHSSWWIQSTFHKKLWDLQMVQLRLVYLNLNTHFFLQMFEEETARICRRSGNDLQNTIARHIKLYWIVYTSFFSVYTCTLAMQKTNHRTVHTSPSPAQGWQTYPGGYALLFLKKKPHRKTCLENNQPPEIVMLLV